MTARIEACLSLISEEWTSLPEASRPPDVWIAQRQSYRTERDLGEMPVSAVWHLDHDGLVRRRVGDFIRFLSIHAGAAWYRGALSPPRAAIFRAGTHEIGLANFAEVPTTGQIYIETIWGGLNGTGAHYRYDPSTAALECERVCWRS